MKYSTPDALPSGGGNWIDKPGTYHLVITATDEEPTSKDKKLIDGFKVDFQAVEGTVRDADGKFTEANKTLDMVFFNPKITDKNEGLFARQKQAAFFIAAGLMTEEQLGGQEIDIDLTKAVGRNVIATLEEDKQDNGKSFIRLSYADIFHIDDPRASKFPRNERALSLIPAEHRRDPKSFKFEEQSKPAGNSNAGGNAGGKVNLDDL